jgi:hypothetical protein
VIAAEAIIDRAAVAGRHVSAAPLLLHAVKGKANVNSVKNAIRAQVSLPHNLSRAGGV